MDTHAGGLRGRAECFRGLVVRKVVDEAHPERVQLALRELRERLVEAVEPGLLGLDGCRLAVQALENAEPCTGRALETPSANGGRQDVARDAEEPRSRRPACDVLEASAAEPRLCERLCRQSCAASAFRLRARWKRYIRSAYRS